MPYFHKDITANNITPPATTGWQNMDCSPHVSSDATIVIIRGINVSGVADAGMGARHPSQVDALNSILALNTQNTFISGMDSSKYVSLYKGASGTPTYYVSGYFTGSEATWLSSAVSFVPTTGSWQTVNLANSIPGTAGANFAIILVQTNAKTYGYNARAMGSTDDRKPTNSCGMSTLIVPLDSNLELEIYNEDAATTFKLVGYINTGTKRVNGLLISGGLATGSYVETTIDDISISGGLSTTNLAAIVEIQSGGAGKAFDYREVGSTDTFYYDNYDFNGFHIVPVNPTTKKIEIKREDTGVNYYVVGYLHPPTITGSGGITWPLIDVLGTGILTLFGSGAITWPSFDFTAYQPITGSGALIWPAFDIDGIGVQGHYGILQADLPFIDLFMDAGGVLQADLPFIELTIAAMPYHAGSLIADLPFIELTLSGLQGNIGTMTVDLPFIDLTLAGHTGTFGILQADLPGIEILIRQLLANFGCVVINLSNKAVSNYTNFKFNSIAKHKGIILAASDSGIYKLGGDTDNGVKIDSVIKTVRDDFGIKNIKNIPEVFVGFEGGQLKIKVGQDYSMSNTQIVNSATDMKNRRAKFSLAEQHRYWNIELSNVNGSDFSVDDIEFPAISSKKAIKG